MFRPQPAGVKTTELATVSRVQINAVDPNLPGSIGGVGGVIQGSDLLSVPISPDSSQLNLVNSQYLEPTRRKRRRVSYSAEFLTFWDLYPNKVKKLTAAAAWVSEKPPLADIRAALSWQIPEWGRKNFEFCPHPTTYINQRRWEDQPTVSTGLVANGQARNYRQEATANAFIAARAARRGEP